MLDLFSVERYNLYKKDGDDIIALINCPECNKEISDKAETCPHCGYKLPKQEPMFQGVYCPKCLKASWTKDGIGETCIFCNTKMKKSIYATYDEVHQFCENHPELKQSPEFSQEAYNKRVNYVPVDYMNVNAIKCPTCGSSNDQNIQTGERVASVAMFRLFSKKMNKSFKCNNCGYTW